MAGRPAGNVITRYAGIQVQTSALGVQIPVGWGTFRCKCNLVWYNNFKSTPQTSNGGKGGSTVTGYSYSASIVLAICEGPIDAITTVYVDSNVYTNGSTTALAQANLNMATGAIGQAVWSYLTSNYPAQAIGYSGLAIAYQSNYALDSGAATPNHSFEVVRTTSFGVSGTPDADPSLVVSDFFTNTRTGVPSWGAGLLGSMTQYQDYCLAAGLLVSPVIDQERSASDFLTELLLATNSTCVWSEGLLKFIPYGDAALSGNGKTYTPNNTPVYALNDDNYVVEKDDAPVQVDIMDQSDAYNVVQLEYLDRTNQYNMAIALASDAANVAQYGMRRQDPTTVHCICTPAVAAISAQLYLQRTLYIRAQYKFKLGWMFALFEPGDILELTDTGLGLAAYPVRIVQIAEDEHYGLSLVCEDFPVGIANSPLYTMQNGIGYQVNQGLDPGGVEANLLLQSGDIGNSAWTKTNATLTSNSTTDQYGLTTAALFKPSTASGVHAASQAVTVFAGLNYTFSVCLQKDVHKNWRVAVTDSGGANGGYIEVDTNAGVILTQGTALGTGIVLSASLNTTLVSGIWQVVITINVPSVTTLYPTVSMLSDAGVLSWTGDASNGGYVSQAQFRQGVAAGVYAATTTAVAAPIIFNPPSALADSIELWAAVAGGPNWGGCHVWVSVDGTNYAQVGTVDAPARYGSATTSLASHADPDTSDSVGVDLGCSAGALAGASQASADNGGTLCLIDGELICFEAATLTNPSRYTLGTYLRRGYLNTTIAAHSAGAPFVRLDSAPFQFPYLSTNAGQTVSIKFQSFNQWGRATVSLSDCITYTATPIPMGATAPASTAWTAVGTSFSNAGQSIPAIVITGASDNLNAQGVEFLYRVTGTTTWSSAGVSIITTTRKEITSVTTNTQYDVGVRYIVNGVPGAIQLAGGSPVTVGALSTGAGVGSVLLSDSATTTTQTFTLPSGSYTKVQVELWGPGGDGNFLTSKSGSAYYGGGGGEYRIVTNISVTPGTTTITYNLSDTVGTASTVTATGPFTAMSAHSGTSATTSAEGTGGSGGSGGTGHNGHNGGLTDTWDGGGAYNGSVYADQTTNGAGGTAPGGGGAGAAYNSSNGSYVVGPHAAGAIKITATA